MSSWGPKVPHADSEDSDHTGRMPRLIWVFAGRTLILLVFSRRGSNGFSYFNSIILFKQRTKKALIRLRIAFVVRIRQKQVLSWRSCHNVRQYELPHDKTNKMTVRPAKTQISLSSRPVWSESSLSARRKLGSLATHWVYREDSDQTGRMPRLIWVFAWPESSLGA